MDIKCRPVLENITFTEEEKETLIKAKKIIFDAINEVFKFEGEYDKDLIEALNECADGISKCYPRLNIDKQ